MKPFAIRLLVLAAFLAGFSASVVAPAAADAPALTALDAIAPGNWRIRFRPDNARQDICLHNGRDLIQLRHRTGNCSQFVVEETSDRVTVQYTCRGHGYGRTHIRHEPGNILQIESQGIVDGQPFQFSAEARRTGRCGG